MEFENESLVFSRDESNTGSVCENEKTSPMASRQGTHHGSLWLRDVQEGLGEDVNKEPVEVSIITSYRGRLRMSGSGPPWQGRGWSRLH